MLDHPLRKILVVDDNPLMLHLLDKLLSAGGFEVHQALSGTEALEKMQIDYCDFVITDLNMPHMDGLELCRKLRQLPLPNYVFIGVLTSSDRSEDLIQALDSGADDFYRKPVVAGELLARLRAGTRLLSMERQLRSLASLDPLTEAINRRTFDEFSNREWGRAERHATPLSCIMMDVDYFKIVNDRFGHPVGDTVLREITKILREQCRVPDYLCRYGGEEFSILLPNTDETGASVVAERCRAAIMRTPFFTPECDIHLSASFGAAERDIVTNRPADMLCHADQALLWAKKQGRNQVYTYTQSQMERGRILAVAAEFPNQREIQDFAARRCNGGVVAEAKYT
jgi:two-component system cell cycle response regulator